MTFRLRQRTILLLLSVFVALLTTQAVVSAPTLPNPVLKFLGTESVKEAGKDRVKYLYEVSNKSKYPTALFAPAPDMPPCGRNNSASRTWLDFYDEHGKRLWGFCALAKPADLGSIWFTLDQGEVPPGYVYIELLDRKTNTKYKSNLAKTTK